MLRNQEQQRLLPQRWRAKLLLLLLLLPLGCEQLLDT
jgi:hypothetical protein